MTTLFRKVLVLTAVGIVLVFANLYEIVRWIAELGIPAGAEAVRDRYLSGCAITIIIVLVFLLKSDRTRRHRHDIPSSPYDDGPRPRHRRWDEW